MNYQNKIIQRKLTDRRKVMHLSEEHASQLKVKIHSVAVLQSIVFQHPVIDTGI